MCVCVYVYLHKGRRTEGRTVGENFLYITGIRLSLFIDSMVLYVENLKKSTNTRTHKNMIELINKFSKFAGYKISMQVNVISIYFQ